jgi:hypothetical protein
MSRCRPGSRRGQRVCDANLVEDIWISACAVTDDDTGAVDERNNVLDDSGVCPNVVCSYASEASRLCRGPKSGVDSIEARVERHHRRHEAGFDILVCGQLKDPRSRAARLAIP